MTRNDVILEIRKTIANNAGEDMEPPGDDQTLFCVGGDISFEQARAKGDYGLDSLDRVEVGMAIEEIFDIEISDAETDQLTTVNAIADLVMAKLA